MASRVTKTATAVGNEFNEGNSNFTRVGNPVISDDSILSGMVVNNNYITKNINFTNMDTFEISCGFTANTTSTGRHKTVWHLWDGGTSNALQFWLNNGGDTTYQLIYPTSNTEVGSLTFNSIPTNTKHTATFNYNGTTISVYIDNVLKSSVSVNKIYLQKQYTLTIGTCSLDNHAKYFAGTIDLKDFSIKVNGNVIFTPATNKASISNYQITASEFIEI